MNPKLSKRSLSAIEKVISGNEVEKTKKPVAPYRSGPDLVGFFRELGFDDSYGYGGGFPSRWAYVESRLESLNGTPKLLVALEAAVEPGHFLDSDFSVDAAVEHLNKYLARDGWTLVPSGKGHRAQPLGEPTVVVEAKLQPTQHASHEFIAEQVGKCDRKLVDGDYDGAITNARSVVEAVLRDLESRLDANAPKPDGDVQKLYKRVQKLLNLDPERPDVTESLRLLLRGLVNIIGGLAPLRNMMGDAHARTYKPARHHAKLAVNAAKTLLDFVYDTFEFQKGAGRIKEVPPSGRGSST